MNPIGYHLYIPLYPYPIKIVHHILSISHEIPSIYHWNHHHDWTNIFSRHQHHKNKESPVVPASVDDTQHCSHSVFISGSRLCWKISVPGISVRRTSTMVFSCTGRFLGSDMARDMPKKTPSNLQKKNTPWLIGTWIFQLKKLEHTPLSSYHFFLLKNWCLKLPQRVGEKVLKPLSPMTHFQDHPGIYIYIGFIGRYWAAKTGIRITTCPSRHK